jgi:hypothetical protein
VSDLDVRECEKAGKIFRSPFRLFIDRHAGWGCVFSCKASLIMLDMKVAT